MHDLSFRYRAHIEPTSSPVEIWSYTKQVFETLNIRMRDIRDHFQEGIGRAIVADALPTAGIEYIGEFIMVRGYGGGDTLYICVQTGASTYAWVEVALGAAASRYEETFTATSTKTVTHNLGARPIVQVSDSSGNVINVGVQHTSVNACTLSFLGTLTSAVVVCVG